MIDRFEILASRVRQLVSRNRWSARLIGYPPIDGHENDPGLVLIQIDGLGEELLREILREGRMPFLARLVQRDGYQIRSVYTGIPSSTPGFQAELFYGVPSAVPAFGYRDPVTGKVFSMNDPGSAREMEDRLEREHEGLLRDGSAWSNVFGGGASEPHLCATTVGLGATLRGLTPKRIVGLVLWHSWSLLRVVGNLLAITALVFWDLFRGKLPPRALWNELKYVPLRVVLSAIMREIITAGASIDAERGLPVIQLNYLGYDEHAHRRGPRSRFARWSLRGIDRSLRRIWLASHRSPRRDYQVWVYSDHGQEAVEPYPYRHGKSIPDAVRSLYRSMVSSARPGAALTGEEDGASALTASRARWFGLPIPRWIVRPQTESVPDENELLVVNQGPLGFVYLPPDHDPGFVENFARALARDARIPLTLIPDAPGTARAFVGELEFHLPEQAAAVLGPDHPHLEATARDLARIAHHPGAGPIVISGFRRGAPLSLQVEHGSHGGPGPNETSAFVVLPPEAQTLARAPSELRPADLRLMAMRTLHRFELVGEIQVPEQEYYPPTLEEKDGEVTVLLRLMTYNVHGCRGMDGVYSPGRIARVIARERPDIVCLQELDQERIRSGGIDQAQLIADRLQLEYHFHAVSELDDGKFGNAVLSFLPLRPVDAGALPSIKTAFNLWDRGVLRVAAAVGDREVEILNTHLSILDRERQVQARELVGPRWLAEANPGKAVILAGDMNAGPGSPTLQILESALRSAIPPEWEDRALNTWSGRVPVRRIDHVFVNDRVTVNNVYVPRTRLSRVASDHLPLVADLVCRFPAPRAETRQAVTFPPSSVS